MSKHSGDLRLPMCLQHECSDCIKFSEFYLLFEL